MAGNESKMIGGFRIDAELKTSGTQGRVYRAVCETDELAWCAKGTVVALKTMQVSSDGDSSAEKLRQHTETLVAIRHPNVVRYLGCFVEQSAFSEMHVVVQEFLYGESLKDRLATHPTGLDADEALKVIGGMVAGLAAAAERGIVHRDVKPDNVFLCQDGSVKLIDFEVARQSESTTSASGNMVGSFDYMAPDFADPHFSGDERSDIFSAGAVMHEVLTGKLPYRRFVGQAQQASFAFLERWSRDSAGKFIKGSCSVSASLERVVAHARPVLVKALSLQRETRFATFAEFGKALEDIRFRDLKNGNTSYRILQLVGKGGFGEVFKARNGGRTFAIKHLLKPEYASRFFREAKIMSGLDDSCFVRFFDFFILQHSGVQEAFLVMDFLPGMPGSSLRDAIRKSAGCGLDFESVLKAFVRYAHGLRMIHDKGIYHRDIKPTNLYYPEDRPDSASIMDLGIARDESGTETTGQVPGTLDYMPPETALGGTRGDAGMDIYALGLCMYEALSGKKGFPRLPTGSQGYAQFFQRAKDKLKPTFDDPRVIARPDLLALLRRMTEPELAGRLSDAAVLEAELKRVLEGGPAVEDAEAATATVAPAVPEEDHETEDDEGETCETAFVPQADIPRDAVKVIDAGLRKLDKSRSRRGSRILGILLVCAAGLLLLAGAVFYRSEIDRVVSKVMQSTLRHTGAHSDATAVFDGEDLGIPDVYGDDSSTLEQADDLRDRWLSDRKSVLNEHEYIRAVGFFEQKREQRVIRNRLDSEKSKFDADVKETIRIYLEQGVSAGDGRRKTWMESWGMASKSKIEGAMRLFDKARRDRMDIDAAKSLLPRATAAADAIVRSYAENGLKIADREAEIWRHDWGKRLLKEDYEKQSGRLAAARDEVLRKIAERERNNARKALFDECRALIEMVSPVQSRDARLREAETKLQQAVAAKLIDAKDSSVLMKEIETVRGWTVFEIVNHSDLDLKVGGIEIKNTDSHIFVFTNAPPETLAVECFGYESFPLGRQTDGKRVTLLPEHFALLKVEVSVGELEDGVSCRVDGISVKDKLIKVVPGAHECVYSKADYKVQTIPFRVEPGVAIALPGPGKWARSEEWLQKERDRKRAERAKAMEAECAALLKDEPISNRVERLAQCGKILRDWTAPDTLGEQKHKEFSARLAAAELRSFGAVVNETEHAFEAEVSGNAIKFPPKARVLVEYSAKEPLTAELRAHGYEPISFPEKFCGVDFHVVAAMVIPSPVEVSVLDRPEGVVFVVDGEEAPANGEGGAAFKALPGDHTLVYRRTDYEDVQVSFTVKIGEPLTLRCPYQWKASQGMVNLIAAEAAADKGDWNHVKTLLGAVNVRGESNLKRKMALNLRFEQRKRFLQRLDEAALAYHEERWHDVVKVHFDLKLNGYEMTQEDRERVAVSIEKRSGHLDMLKKIAGTGDFGASTEKIDAEIRSFRAMAGLLEKEIQAALKGEKQ